MKEVTISSKNQITLPAKLMRELGLKPGQKTYIQKSGKKLIINTVSAVDAYAGSLKNGGQTTDAATQIRKLRDSDR